MAKSNGSIVRQIAFTEPVTPSDSADIPRGLTRALFVNVAGNVAVRYSNGMTDTLTLSAGVVYPFQVVRVLSTGTTATGVKACY